MPPTYLHSLLESIVERGRSVFEAGRWRDPSGRDLPGLVQALVDEPGEASGLALAREILDSWRALSPEGRAGFFRHLAERFGAREAALEEAIRAWQADPGPASARRVHEASEPRRQELLRRLNRVPGGTSALVEMRAALLDLLREDPALSDVDADFQHLFSSWFNRGFLVLRRIDWNTPAVILERIIRYEAVHEINGWEDLRRRIDPPDRRLYAFFHPALADEPLIFVQVALMEAIPGAIGPILAEERAPLDPAKATVAVFYSISNCQKGLRGISFGNFLLKQVVEELGRGFPGLRSYATLSPVPGFRRWLDAEGRATASPEARAALEALENPDWPRDPQAVAALTPVLKGLVAEYLLCARGRSGQPLDPVARFHLGNGAHLERINVLGNPGPRGMAESLGTMVNYVYDMARIERNHEAFASKGTVAAAPSVRKLAPASSR